MRLSSIAAALVALAVVFFQTQSVMAANLFFSASGSGVTCSQSAPCTLETAIEFANPAEDISCADSSSSSPGVAISKSLTIDCAGTAGSISGFNVTTGAVLTLRNLTAYSNGGSNFFLQGGTVVMDNVQVTGGTQLFTAQSTSSSTLIVKNCVFDSGAAGFVLRPNAGGSLSAVFEHVTIANNNGGGIKIDTTNGPVTVDITDSVISNNAGNGLNAVGGAGGPAVFNIHNSVIAKNGVAGIQVNGATAAMIDTTLLDSNGSGATSVVAGGHMLTYGNNRIVGTAGSGFTGSAALQ